MNTGTVYVIGAGLAGLSAAVALADKKQRVEVIEAAPQAGGRCRSYFDTTLGQTIDNGNHLVLSGNHATMKYLSTIGASDRLAGPDNADIAFVDLARDEHWTIKPGNSVLPFWIFDSKRRVPGTTSRDYLEIAKLLGGRPDQTVGDILSCKGPLWDRLLEPFLLAALNTKPEIGSASLAGKLVRETFAKGGKAYRPRIAHPTLAAAFVDPALRFLAQAGARVRLGERVRRIVLDGRRAMALEIAQTTIPLSRDDRVVLATPPWVTRELLPDVTVPDAFCAIVNAHFAFQPPPGAQSMIGVIGGTAEWVFSFPDRLSVTVSGADRLVDTNRVELAQLLWRDVAKVHGLAEALPPWQIVKERRATFAATPEQVRKRPKAQTPWRNLFLAGDWTDTGLPSTIESAVRSGHKAAELALARSKV